MVLAYLFSTCGFLSVPVSNSTGIRAQKSRVRALRTSYVTYVESLFRLMAELCHKHSFLPWGRNECMTNEPQRTSAGRYQRTRRILSAEKSDFRPSLLARWRPPPLKFSKNSPIKPAWQVKQTIDLVARPTCKKVYLAKALRHPLTVQILLALCALRLPSLSFESFWVMKAYSVYLFAYIAFCLLQSGK